MNNSFKRLAAVGAVALGLVLGAATPALATTYNVPGVAGSISVTRQYREFINGVATDNFLTGGGIVRTLTSATAGAGVPTGTVTLVPVAARGFSFAYFNAAGNLVDLNGMVANTTYLDTSVTPAVSRPAWNIPVAGAGSAVAVFYPALTQSPGTVQVSDPALATVVPGDYLTTLMAHTPGACFMFSHWEVAAGQNLTPLHGTALGTAGAAGGSVTVNVLTPAHGVTVVAAPVFTQLTTGACGTAAPVTLPPVQLPDVQLPDVIVPGGPGAPAAPAAPGGPVAGVPGTGVPGPGGLPAAPAAPGVTPPGTLPVVPAPGVVTPLPGAPDAAGPGGVPGLPITGADGLPLLITGAGTMPGGMTSGGGGFGPATGATGPGATAPGAVPGATPPGTTGPGAVPGVTPPATAPGAVPGTGAPGTAPVGPDGLPLLITGGQAPGFGPDGLPLLITGDDDVPLAITGNEDSVTEAGGFGGTINQLTPGWFLATLALLGVIAFEAYHLRKRYAR